MKNIKTIVKGNTHVSRLPCGATVITVEDDNSDRVSLHFAFRTGSRYEKPSEHGWSHFLEHMVFNGSKKYPTSKAIDLPIERTGGYLNAFTGKSTTTFVAEVPFDKAKVAIDILADMTVNPILSKKDIEKEIPIVIEEIKMCEQDVGRKLDTLSDKALWGEDSSLGRNIIGTEKSLAGITEAKLKKFHRNRFFARNAVFGISGKIKHDQFLELVKPYLDQLPRRKPDVIDPPKKSSKKVEVDRMESRQLNTEIAFVIPKGLRSKRKGAVAVLSEILGGGRGLGSRLNTVIREKMGLAYGIHAGSSSFGGVSYFAVNAGLNYDKAEKAFAAIGRELKRIATKKVGRAEWARVMDGKCGAIRMRVDSTSMKISNAVTQYMCRRKIKTSDEIIEHIRKVKPEDVLYVANKIFQPKNMAVAMVLPKDAEDKIETKLVKAIQAAVK